MAKKPLTNGTVTLYSVMQRLQEKAISLDYGVITCQVTVAAGKVRQFEITELKERYKISDT